MQFTTLAAAAILATAAAAHSNVTYVTEVVQEFVTFCPEPTTLTYNDVTYTITEATTLTITDCAGGCTVTKPILSVVPTVVCSTCEVKPTAPAYVNSTVPVVTAPAPGVPSQSAPVVVAPSGTGAPLPSKPAFTGAANRAAVGSAAGLAGLLGFAAYIL